MMSTFNIILLCYFFVYIIQSIAFITWTIREHERDIFLICFMLSPFVSTIGIFAAIIHIIYYNISEKKRDLKNMKLSLKIQLKEREEKIKKGIIRVSELDPYGEENWNN